MTKMCTQTDLRRGARRAAGVVCALFAVTGVATAQDAPLKTTIKSNAWSTQTLTTAPNALDLDVKGLTGLTALSGTEDLVSPLASGGGVTDSMFDLTSGDQKALFNLDESGQLCLRTTEECALNDDSFGLGIQGDFAKDSKSGLGLALQPRAGVSFDDDSSSALVGALVKIGDNLQNADDIDPNTWYFFAGADAQAMTYTPGSEALRGEGRFALRDSVIVGDAQAGVAYRLGAADVSLTYLRREARAENYKFEEDAAAVSLTWRR